MAGLFADGAPYAFGDGMIFASRRREEGQDAVSLAQIGAFQDDSLGGVASLFSHEGNRSSALSRCVSCCLQNGTGKDKKRRDRIITPGKEEATSGFEPLVQLLQSRALPLGDVAINMGAGDGDRTRDFLLGKEMLYH